jgi:septum formation protein
MMPKIILSILFYSRYAGVRTGLPNPTPSDRNDDMLNNIQHTKLILASKSPRRKYLLEQAGIEFDVIHSHFDESSIPLREPNLYVQDLSLAKAGEVARQYPDRWIIAADTIVIIDGQVLGKPKGKKAACRMLSQLSGQTHQVLTGYTICNVRLNKNTTDSIRTDVTFKHLTPNEIEWYIHTDEPFDKAGAYAIQGLGTFLVKTINGSYTNVVGLPVCEVVEILIREGVIKMDQTAEHWTRIND